MKNIFEKFFKKKYIPTIELGRVISARFEANEMAVGILDIKTRQSRTYWVDWLSKTDHVDFLLVALLLMDKEIAKQKENGYAPKYNVKYPERKQVI
jgi:hypothetical protein